MTYLKISNVSTSSGNIDYKGLNIEMFVMGSQGYMPDLSYCVVQTTEEAIVQHADVEVLTEEQYLSLREIIDAENESQANPNPAKELQERVDLMQQALDDLLMGGMI